MFNSRSDFTRLFGGVLTIALLSVSWVCQSSEYEFGRQGQLEAKAVSDQAISDQAISDQATILDRVQMAAVVNDQSQTAVLATVEEARVRAKILHEVFGGALHVMHRDYFREDQRLKLPSKSLEDVFAAMAKTHQVKLRWLAVNANAMNVDHKPQNEFEKQAVKAITSGKDEYEFATEKLFHYAGSITLSASCVKCHVRRRTSNDQKKAALVISIPLQEQE